MAAIPDCQLVCVPGQKFWHTHVCPTCESFWTHIAPTPMTQGKNREIHTCTKCGTEVYEFVKIQEESGQIAMGLPWVAAGVLVGLLGAALIDRRR
jgi:hypothetical protein